MNKLFNSDQPWMLISMSIVVVVVAVVGGVVTITDPATLSFEEYLDKLLWLAGAVAVFGGARKVGDAIDSNKSKRVDVKVETEEPQNAPARQVHPTATSGVGGSFTTTLGSTGNVYREPEYDPRLDTEFEDEYDEDVVLDETDEEDWEREDEEASNHARGNPGEG